MRRDEAIRLVGAAMLSCSEEAGQVGGGIVVFVTVLHRTRKAAVAASYKALEKHAVTAAARTSRSSQSFGSI
jgi:hypothetical protein